MEYTCEIRIDRPRDQVVAMYSDHSELSAWYPGFVRLEPLVKNYGVAGSTAYLFCKTQHKVNKMLVTIEEVDLPLKITMKFECDDVWYRNESSFFDDGDHTIWKLSVVFGFRGIMRWAAKAHLPFFKNVTMEKMTGFKDYAHGRTIQKTGSISKMPGGFAID